MQPLVVGRGPPLNWKNYYCGLNSGQSLVKQLFFVENILLLMWKNDIWNPSGNRRTSGFLIQEREWFTRFLNSGWNDKHRMHFSDVKGPYTWWSNRGQAREYNRGWRID